MTTQQQPYTDNYQDYTQQQRQSSDEPANFGAKGADPDHYYLMNRRQQMAQQMEQENESSGLGAPTDNIPIGMNDGSLDMGMMVRGSITSSNDGFRGAGAGQDTKNSDDLTLDMLGGPTTATAMTLAPQNYNPQQSDFHQNSFMPPITSKNPPSSALNLHANLDKDSRATFQPGAQQQNPYGQSSEPALSLEQYRQNNANLTKILMQFDSTPQFNQMIPTTNKHADSAPHSMKVPSNAASRAQLGQLAPGSSDTLNEVSQFNYMPQNQRPNMKPEAADQIEQIRDNLSKIELLQQAIHTQANSNPNSNQSQRRTGLQQAGFQIMQNENKNVNNYPQSQLAHQPQPPVQQQLRVDKSKSQPIPDQNVILDQHKAIMTNFDEIPISKIKNMVGYQTNQDMYRADAKLPEEEGIPDPKQYAVIKEQTPRGEGSDESEGEDNLSLEERLISTRWKVRMRACKEINQLFYNDYAKSQSDPDHPLQSFEEYGPQLQEMIKDTNLTNAYEALQCLHSYVRFAPDIKQVAFACHIYLLEKVNTTKSNFRDITLKIITCMLRRLQGPSNTILPELLKRFKTKNTKCATFCLQVISEAFKTKEQVIIQEVNISSLFKSIQTGLTHSNKEIRDHAYQILKHIGERCKDDAAVIVANCQNLRPVQIKELTEELSKVEKIPNLHLSLFDESHDEVHEKKHKQVIEISAKLEPEQKPKAHEPEIVDLFNLIPDDFNETQYATQINTKKKSMEHFNTELVKVVTQQSVIKIKDYQMLLNVVFHMLEDKNMLVFMEAIKSVELLSVLQVLKKEKVRPFLTLLAGKYGETKTAVIAATDKAMAAIVKHSLTPTQFAETIINQIATSHKNPRVKQYLLTNPLTQMLNSCDAAQSVFKQIQKSLWQLILKDNNDQVRNAAVGVVIEVGLLLINDEAFQTQIQSLITTLPKSRITEINKKLQPQDTQIHEQAAPLSKTMGQQPKAPTMAQESEEDEFSKTLAPAKLIQPLSGQFYQTLMKLIRTLPSNPLPKQQLQAQFDEALSNEDTLMILVKNRLLISKAFAESLSTQAKALSSQREQVLLIVDLVKELFMHNIEQQQSAEDLADFVKCGLLLTEVGVEQDTGVLSSILVLGMEASQDTLEFLEMLRCVLETQQIMSCSQAIKIISNVYLWLGLKLNDFVRSGMQMSDIEELRGFGIKYLESTHLFNEKQRQQLISVMIRFKDQIQEQRQEQLQTLGQNLPSARSQQSSVVDTKQQTAQFNQEIQPITAQLICQTIDKEFEQGLLMFKKLAQSNQGLDFDTKQQIFYKLLGIVSEGLQSQSPPQQQQYRQAYALKALMWMKEETMGLEDTFKLTAPILTVYQSQIQKEIDASVELYLLNFWVRELSTRDLCDRISNSVQQIKSSRSKRPQYSSSEDQLDGFKILFSWLCENKLDPSPSDWKLSDLRKIALLICESVLSQSKAKAVCRAFLTQCVERDTKEKVLEFMEIQLMHSNEVFLQFLDWFQVQFPTKQSLAIDVRKAMPSESIQESMQLSERSNQPDVPQQHQSYIERRQQMKMKPKNDQSEQARAEITKIEDSSLQQQSLMQEVVKPPSRQSMMSGEPRRSRYEEKPSNEFDSIDNDEPIEEFKEIPQMSQTKQRQNTELEKRVEQSEAKQRDWVSKIIELEAEKRRIEDETYQLKQQNNQESQAWRQKLQEMQNEHHEVAANLTEVNQCYLQQVDENEQLKVQLSQMQRQHEDMMTRFEQIERKVNSRQETSRAEEAPQTPPRNESRRREPIMNSVAKLQRISDTFCVSDQQIGIGKICELLLSAEKNVDGELAKPLISHYQRFRTVEERLSMITALGEALSINEDVLLALSIDVYKALLNFLLRAFAHEKERLDTQSMGREKQEQNQVTMESQKLVSRLLNSKDFTASLVSLFQLLREAMPEDLAPALAIEDGQYLRVLMRCINRITKALHSESSELIRGFDVLLEMQKIFLICPPENLREDLPSLADFDFVFRGMKDVSDKFIELQPTKVMSFLGYCETKGQSENAFMKYLRMKVR